MYFSTLDSDFEDVPEYGVSLEAAEEDRNDNKSIDLTMDVEEELKEKPIVSNLGRNFVVIMDESTNAIPAKDQTKDNEFKDMSQVIPNIFYIIYMYGGPAVNQHWFKVFCFLGENPSRHKMLDQCLCNFGPTA